MLRLARLVVGRYRLMMAFERTGGGGFRIYAGHAYGPRTVIAVVLDAHGRASSAYGSPLMSADIGVSLRRQLARRQDLVTPAGERLERPGRPYRRRRR